MSRALPTPRSLFATTIGNSVVDVVSANVSAVPRTNSATSTREIATLSSTIVALRTASTSARTAWTATMILRRSKRSAATPATRPNSSHGRRWSTTARATRNGSRVREATRSGPAAREIPSPRLLAHDDPSNHRKGRPSRAGATASTSVPTMRAIITHPAPSPEREIGWTPGRSRACCSPSSRAWRVPSRRRCRMTVPVSHAPARLPAA